MARDGREEEHQRLHCGSKDAGSWGGPRAIMIMAGRMQDYEVKGGEGAGAPGIEPELHSNIKGVQLHQHPQIAFKLKFTTY